MMAKEKVTREVHMRIFQKFASITHNLGLPSICILCNQFHKGALSLCNLCVDLLTPLNQACQHCAHPLPPTSHLLCGNCIKKPPHFDRAYVSYLYEEPLRSLIHQLKYYKKLHLASTLSYLMIRGLQEFDRPECLVPVPMHSKRIRQRGFNQSALLTKLIAKQLRLPYQLNCSQKISNTLPQAGLNSEQRRKNLRNTFKTVPLPYKHIMLIDDLLTTGSTANELAKAFKKTGIERVDICCCARAVLGAIDK